MIRSIISLIIITLIIPVCIYSKTIWKDINIYASGAGLNIGDVITVSIEDISKLKFSMNYSDEKSFNIISNPDSGLTPFLPRISSNKNKKDNDKSSFSGTGSLSMSIASRITDKLNDGKLRITGTREYIFNGIINRFSVNGIIDPALIKGRSVQSKEVADFVLDIRGITEKGAILLQRPDVKEGESSNTNLTEQEKQNIIINYLNKMINELTK